MEYSEDEGRGTFLTVWECSADIWKYSYQGSRKLCIPSDPIAVAGASQCPMIDGDSDVDGDDVEMMSKIGCIDHSYSDVIQRLN